MTEIDALLQENRKFPPSKEFKSKALLNDPKVYEQDPEKFWEDRANELEWFSKWKTVCEWTPPHSKWFVGGKINVSVNCVDRHIKGAARNKAALIW